MADLRRLHRADPSFCTTGTLMNQAVATGQLQAGFYWLGLLGALDAPQSISLGGSFGYTCDAWDFALEITHDRREGGVAWLIA